MISLIIFYSVCFSFTFLFWCSAVIAPVEFKHRHLFVFLGGAGPLLGALVSSLAIFSPQVSFDELISRMSTLPDFSTARGALLIPLSLVSVALILCQSLAPHIIALSVHQPSPQKPDSLYPASVPGPLLYLAMLGFCPVLILEELGWRGVLLPELLRAGCSPLMASFLVGVSWALWHLPLMHHGPDPARPAHALAAETIALIPKRMAVYMLTLSLLSVLITHLTLQDTSHSIWTPVLFHGSFNASFALFRIERTARIFEPLLLILLIVSCLGCLF